MMDRTPDAALALILNFDVEHLPCMQPCDIVDRGVVIHVTRCSDYAKVWFAAYGCPLPVGMTANELHDWFTDGLGALAGWVLCDLTTALRRANLGYPTVAVMKEAGHGHIAPCVPSPASDSGHLYVSAAGGKNANRCHIELSFGVDGLITYATHQ